MLEELLIVDDSNIASGDIHVTVKLIIINVKLLAD